MLAYLAARPDALQRSCAPGHFTASTLVVDPSRDAVLLTLHPRVGKWLQLGGHFENDPSIVDAALREAVEEGGIAELELDPQVLNLAVHPVTCSLGVPTRHLDVRFLAVAPAGAEPAISAESLDLRWFHRDRLPDLVGADVPDQVHRAFTRLG
jgi:8-oxo-dGTP pyrophosphatase MutT (NUDIX family)